MEVAQMMKCNYSSENLYIETFTNFWLSLIEKRITSVVAKMGLQRCKTNKKLVNDFHAKNSFLLYYKLYTLPCPHPNIWTVLGLGRKFSDSWPISKRREESTRQEMD